MPEVEITQKGYECTRCGYQWIPRGKVKPLVCPDCNSPYWDKERTREGDYKTKKEAEGS